LAAFSGALGAPDQSTIEAQGGAISRLLANGTVQLVNFWAADHELHIPVPYGVSEN
jgi:hypothetical protein